MRNKLLIIFTLLLISVVSTGCSKKEDDDATVVVTGSFDKNLSELFPQEKGWQWEYAGTSEYAHFMHLNKVYEAGSQKVLTLNGEVKDLTNGLSHSDYSLEITYAIEGDRVIQTKLSDTIMDSEYDKVTLIMSPLVVGTSWKEMVVDSQGKKVEIKGEIIDVESHPDGKIYKILYKETKSDYSEVRKIQEKRGVIEFVKTMKYEDQTVELSYHLNQLLSPDSNRVTNSRTSETDQIKGVIFKFDELWIDFVNQGDTAVMDYVATDSPVAQMINDFQRNDIRQKYLSIDIENITIKDRTAYAEVFEKMQQTDGNETQVFEYRWLYKLEKIGETWYIHSYEENQEK